MLRREIAANGKTRGFINDSPATLPQLRALALLLVDLHQQFDTLELGESGFQREVVDAVSQNEETLQQYRLIYQEWQLAAGQLENLRKQQAEFNREAGFQQFLWEELQDASFRANELEDLENELKMLSHAEGIKGVLTRVGYELMEKEQPMVPLIRQLCSQLNGFASFQENIRTLSDRLETVQIELQDIAGEAEQLNDKVIYDGKRIEQIQERLSLGYKLQKKHGVHSTRELLEIGYGLEEKLKKVLQLDEVIAETEKQAEALFRQAEKQAGILSGARKKSVPSLEEKVNTLLKKVGMPNAKIRVTVSNTPLQPDGKDKIEILFDANRTDRWEPLRKVASGGELSRLMLCIKSLVAETINLPTMIFDEIDSGISGEAARQVGMIMKELAAKRQVIAITHQPQIAGRADAHFFVFKENRDNTIRTNIRQLDREERINVIAQMLSGEKPTAAALENAREMVMN